MVKPSLHIYLRVSSQSQSDDGFGLDVQEKGGRECAANNGFKIVLHKEGAASSHYEDFENRPKLKNLLTMCETGEVEHLYAYNLDRLSRNDLTGSQIRFILKKNGVNLYTNNGFYSLDNPNDAFMMQIMSAVSTLDNEVRLDRLRKGKLERIKRGGWIGGPPPFGYQIVDGMLIENPDESKWIRKIYKWFDDGNNIDDICLKLHLNEVKTRRGNRNWGYQTIRNILSKSVVDGYLTYTDKKLGETVTLTIPAIVEPILSQRVKDKVSKMKIGKQNIKHNSLFKEKMVCGGCGSTYGHRFNQRVGNSSYYCLGNELRHRTQFKGSPKVCKAKDGSRNRSVNMPKADTILWDGIVDILSSSSLYKEGIKSQTLGDLKQPQKDTSSYQTQIKKVDRKIKKLKSSLMDTSIQSLIDDDDEEFDVKAFSQRIQSTILGFESEKKTLKQKLKQISDDRVWVDWVKEFQTHISNLKTNTMSLEEKKRFVDGVVEQIVVTTEDTQTHSFSITFKFPFVGSHIEWRDVKDKSKGYDLIEGETVSKHFLKKSLKTTPLKTP